MEIPRQGSERVEWWAEFYRAVADDAYRIGQDSMENSEDEEAAVFFMEEFGAWLKRGVDISIVEALTCWNALR